jgi:para-aminobenzoate synthetase/4-amino-4-deoxychorismate lyase
VAIRTVVAHADSGEAVCGLGSGITFDSVAEREYDEVKVKSRFLDVAPEPFELLETLLFDGREFWLRERHIERLMRSASHFGFAINRERIEHALNNWRLGARPERARVRLLVSAEGIPRIESVVLEDPSAIQDPVVVPLVPISKKPVATSNTFLFHKTTRREEYDTHAKAHPQAFDVLLWNDRGEVTEFTRGNLVAEIDGKRVTPAIESGLLGGTFREELLARGEIEERVLSLEEVQAARKIWFVNSVRGWVEVMLDSFDELGEGER